MYHSTQYQYGRKIPNNDELLNRQLDIVNTLIEKYAQNVEEVRIHREGGISSYEGIKYQLESKCPNLVVLNPTMKKNICNLMLGCWNMVNRILAYNRIAYTY